MGQKSRHIWFSAVYYAFVVWRENSFGRLIHGYRMWRDFCPPLVVHVPERCVLYNQGISELSWKRKKCVCGITAGIISLSPVQKPCTDDFPCKIPPPPPIISNTCDGQSIPKSDSGEREREREREREKGEKMAQFVHIEGGSSAMGCMGPTDRPIEKRKGRRERPFLWSICAENRWGKCISCRQVRSTTVYFRSIAMRLFGYGQEKIHDILCLIVQYFFSSIFAHRISAPPDKPAKRCLQKSFVLVENCSSHPASYYEREAGVFIFHASYTRRHQSVVPVKLFPPKSSLSSSSEAVCMENFK